MRTAPTLLLSSLLLSASPAGAAGGLFVASQGSRSVLEYDATTGAFERVVVETVSEGFQTLGGIALRPSDGVLHVSSSSSGEIWSYATATGEAIAPVATGLQGPRGLAFDASGATLYFADPKDPLAETTDSLKALALPAGTVSTLGTLTDAEFSGVAVKGAEVFATDVEGHRVVRFPVGGGPGTTVIGAGLSSPTGILFRSATQMLVADSGSDRVLEYVLSGGNWVLDRVVLPASVGVVEPCGLTLAPGALSLSVSGCLSDDVVQVDLTTLVVTPLVAPGAAGLAAPRDLAWSGDTLLVASAVANAVIYFDDSGSPTGVRAAGISAVLDGGLALSPDGERLLVASLENNDVVEHDAESGALLRTFGSVCGFLPLDLDYGPDGRIYVACLGDSSVGRIDPVTGASLLPFVLGGSGGLLYPRSLAFGPDGNLYVSNGTGEVLEYDGATGDFVGVFVGADGNGGGPLDPYGLAFHQGRLYVASSLPSEVMEFDAATGAFVSTFVPSGSGGLSGPTALAFGPNGDLYVTSRDDDAVRRYDGATGAFMGDFVGAGSGGLDGPFDLVFRPGAVATPVPSLTSGGRAALAASLLAAASVARRRRGRA